MLACKQGHVENIKELLHHGANIEHHKIYGETPLTEAAASGNVMAAKVWLSCGLYDYNFVFDTFV